VGVRESSPGGPRVSRGPKRPQEGSQKGSGLGQQKLVRFVSYEKEGKKKKESRADLKKVELLWGSIGALRVPIGTLGGPIEALKGPNRGP
jgi:hypothetical protein